VVKLEVKHRIKRRIIKLSDRLLPLGLAFGLASCNNTAQLMEFPFDAGGRSLNSSAAELQPRIADRFLVFVSDRRGSQDIFLFDAVDRQLIDLPGLNSLDAIASHPDISKMASILYFRPPGKENLGSISTIANCFKSVISQKVSTRKSAVR